jgi:hypothetical protein
MARSFRLLICTAVALASSVARGADPAPATPAATPPESPRRMPGAWLGERRRQAFDGTPSPEMQNARKALEALTPAQRKRFQENFLRWADLTPEEKKALLDREQLRKKIMETEVAAAIQESGLALEGDRREEFIKRYSEERRKIEEQLRREINEKRKPLVRDLIGRLQTEFASPPAKPAP